MCETKNNLRILLFLFLFCGVFLCSCKKQGTEMIVENTEQTIEEEIPKKPVYIWVDISGAVNNPGVYKLGEGARLFEAVEAAGGFTKEADSQWLNQALVLTDGEKIQVYTKEETESMRAAGAFTEKGAPGVDEKGSQGAEQAGKINLNTATLEDLQKIPGIGEVRARAVLTYRDEIGRFQTIDEIQQVPGIKGKTYEKIADYICVD